jgi:hypothetical protein
LLTCAGRQLTNAIKDDIDHMMENLALSYEISFLSLSDVPVKEFLKVKIILT